MTPSPRAHLFSVIIPTFNRPEELRGCLVALRDQRCEDFDFEVLVVDDGSTTDLQPVIDEERGKMEIRLLRQRNAGPGQARNTGAAEARGRFLAFTDDDCRPDPAWLDAFRRCFEIDAGAMVGGRTLNQLERNPFSSASQRVADLVHDYYNPDPDRAFFFASNNMAFPSEAFHDCGGFAPCFRVGAEDREICDRWRVQGRGLRYCPRAVIHHAHHLTFRSFAKQHFNYGRGASRYHRLRKLRNTGRMAEDLAFHGNLLGAIRRSLKEMPVGMKLSQLSLLSIWQLANACGFFYEEFRTLCGKGETLKSDRVS